MKRVRFADSDQTGLPIPEYTHNQEPTKKM